MRRRRTLFALCLTITACVQSADTEPSPSTQPPPTTVSSTTTIPDETRHVGDPVPGKPLWALVEGNDIDADRINLVFAPWGWETQAEFLDFSAGVLSWSGEPYLIDESGRLTDHRSDAADASLGLFGIEPWRSFRDVFNVWYTDVEPDTPVAWLNDGEDPFGLQDAAVVIAALDADRFNPDLTSVAGLDVIFIGPETASRPIDGEPFSNVVIVVNSESPADSAIHIPHELGHALFGLADEYVGDVMGFDGRSDLSSWPSCAEDLSEAAAWWGDLIGSVDDMVAIWAAEMEQAGFPLQDPEGNAAAVAVQDVDGGCYGVSGSVRATQDSLMNTNIPVLGSVNRSWAEQILDLWEGQPRS